MKDASQVRQLNPNWISKMQEKFNGCPYFELQKMVLLDLAWGVSVIEIKVEDRHMQPFGVVHGGVYASLIDAAGFFAVYTQADPGVGMTTVELKLNYLSPSVSGRLIGRGRCINLGRSIGLGLAQIENDKGRLLALGTATVMIKPDMPMTSKIRSVDKYL
jgi:uncharacterized protein (TIGR00369 family)